MFFFSITSSYPVSTFLPYPFILDAPCLTELSPPLTTILFSSDSLVFIPCICPQNFWHGIREQNNWNIIFCYMMIIFLHWWRLGNGIIVKIQLPFLWALYIWKVIKQSYKTQMIRNLRDALHFKRGVWNILLIASKHSPTND